MLKKALLSFIFITSTLIQLPGQINEIDSLKKVVSKGEDTTKLEALVDLSEIYMDIDLDTAKIYLKKIDSLNKKIKQPNFNALVLHNKAGYNFKTGNYNKALNQYKNALTIYQKIENKKKIASTFNNIGIIYDRKGEYEKALEYLLKSLKIQESRGDRIEIAKNYLNIGLLHMRIGNYEKANSFYNKSLKIREELNDKKGLALTYNNMAILYYYMENYGKVRNYFEKAYNIYKGLNNKRRQAMTLSNLGEIYFEIGQLDKALESYKKCMEIEKKLKNKRGLVGTYRLIAQVHTQRGEYDQALKNLKKSHILAKEIDSHTYLSNTYQALYNTYKAKNDYQQALKWHEKYLIMRDSILNESKNKQISELQTKYETKKKEQKIELLNKEKKVHELQIKKQRYFNYFIGIIALVTMLFAIILLIQKRKIKAAHKKLSHQQKQITDSITYASRIQNAILPTNEQFSNILNKEHFILFRPKEIVSGDFYFIDQKNGKKIIAAVDCTGHGVPGAFMSLLGYSFLKEIIKSKNSLEPNIILDELREYIISSLRQTEEIGTGKDGMDISLCIIDDKKQEIHFSGAYQVMLYVRDGNITRYKGDKMPIGIHYNKQNSFSKEIIKYNKGDEIYLFSDGYIDQFGGTKNRKFRLKNLEKNLTDIYKEPMINKKATLTKTFDDWKKGNEQLDDVVLIGLKF
jgi:tetratricopeptide (TPR) repeat protein